MALSGCWQGIWPLLWNRPGGEVFIDSAIQLGSDWSAVIERGIEWADYLVVLLSESSKSSEMVTTEVRLAAKRRKQSGKPRILPIRVRYEGPLGYELESYLGGIEQADWNDLQNDTGPLLTQILEVTRDPDQDTSSAESRNRNVPKDGVAGAESRSFLTATREFWASIFNGTFNGPSDHGGAVGSVIAPTNSLILYAVLVTMIVLGAIAAKGPLELVALRFAGVNLGTLDRIDVRCPAGFAADRESRALATAIVLVTQCLQPWISATLALRGLNTAFRVFIFQPVSRFGRAPQFDTGLSHPKSRDDLHRTIASPEPPPIVAAGAGGVAIGAMDLPIVRGEQDRRFELLMVRLLMFPGSRLQVVLLLVILTVHSGSLATGIYDRAALSVFFELIVAFGPTCVALLLLMVDFSMRTDVPVSRRRTSLSRWYEPYRIALYNSRRPYVEPTTRMAYQVAAGALYLFSSVASIFEIRRDPVLAERLRIMVSAESEERSRLSFPLISRRLETIGEIRAGFYHLRPNPSAYPVLRSSRLVQWITNYVPLF